MNERIEKLLKKAQKITSENHAPGGRDYEREIYSKFAELIVQECMGIISDESEKVSDEWRCKDGQHIWWKIKDHFGIQ